MKVSGTRINVWDLACGAVNTDWIVERVQKVSSNDRDGGEITLQQIAGALEDSVENDVLPAYQARAEAMLEETPHMPSLWTDIEKNEKGEAKLTAVFEDRVGDNGLFFYEFGIGDLVDPTGSELADGQAEMIHSGSYSASHGGPYSKHGYWWVTRDSARKGDADYVSKKTKGNYHILFRGSGGSHAWYNAVKDIIEEFDLKRIDK